MNEYICQEIFKYSNIYSNICHTLVQHNVCSTQLSSTQLRMGKSSCTPQTCVTYLEHKLFTQKNAPPNVHHKYVTTNVQPNT